MSSLRGDRRTEFPVSVKKAAFLRCCQNAPEGVKNIPNTPQCESCGLPLNARTGIIYEHLDADGLGGQPILENCGVWCSTCSDIKTHTEDNPRMAKADRGARKAFGLERPRKKIQSAGFAKAAPQRTASRPIRRHSHDKQEDSI